MGGLEKSDHGSTTNIMINRRMGGLEILDISNCGAALINRRMGGLENVAFFYF